MSRGVWFAFLLLTAFCAPLTAAVDSGDFREAVKVEKPTRLDWEFVAGSFGPDAATVPSDYLSYRQRYQLFVPPGYDAKKAWPLVVFISPGDDPLGWRSWQKVCADRGVFFAAAYGAGNNRPVGLRVRLVLDLFDDLRRHYRIDPEQTYFAGLGEGGRLASALAFGLPELCGGAVLVSATPSAPRLDYLRHRTQDRLSVAFVSGAQDSNRRDIEDNWCPFYQETGVRARRWSMKAGHELPPTETVAEVFAWLTADLPRRRKDSEARPQLAVKPEEAPDGPTQAARLLETAQGEVGLPGRLYRGAVILRGIEARWPKTEAAEKARLLLREVQLDQRSKQTLSAETAADRRRTLMAQARARERLGDLAAALTVYEKLAATHAEGDEGKKVLAEIKRLKEKLAATPYLGIAFEEDGVTIRAVAAHGPAEQAGLRIGDRLAQFGATKIEALADLRRVLLTRKPGDQTTVEVRRAGQALTLPLEIGPTPRDND